MDLLNQKGSFSSASPEMSNTNRNGLQQMEQCTVWESRVLTNKGEEVPSDLGKNIIIRLQTKKANKAGNLDGSPQKF